MHIRKVTPQDFDKLYSLGLNTPELKVSATEDFMDPDEFNYCITNEQGVFLLAEEQEEIIGFLYANAKDAERDYAMKWACLVYIVTHQTYRGKGVAAQLYDAGITALKKKGISHLYAWANPQSGVIPFLEKKGLTQGHSYVWMDAKI